MLVMLALIALFVGRCSSDAHDAFCCCANRLAMISSFLLMLMMLALAFPLI